MLKKFIRKIALPVSCFIVALSAYSQEIGFGIKTVLEPNRRAIISTRVDGNLEEFTVAEGEVFEKGAVLAQIDSRFYKQSLMKAEAILSEAHNALEFNTKNFEQGEKLYKGNNMGLMELEERKFQMTRSDIATRQAQADLEIARLNLSECTISAPFAGRLVKRIARQHEELPSSQTGRQIMEIIDDSFLKAVMYLPSDRFNEIKLGDTVKITIEETKKTYKAKVVEKAAEMDPLSRTFALKARLDNSSQELRAGMVGTLVE